MELRQNRYFVRVVALGSMNRTAPDVTAKLKPLKAFEARFSLPSMLAHALL
ncbi:MAG: hypothetical protein ACK5RC_05885 [Curvibacter sp.]|jgi:hypothetical protein|nr:hypothetical protein [Curvibacter sp.]